MFRAILTPSFQTKRIFDIANVPFEGVSEDEKKEYAGTMKTSGSYQGYKLRQYWVSISLDNLSI